MRDDEQARAATKGDVATPPDGSPGSLRKPTLLQLASSILGAAFGVQSSKVQQRDFGHGSPAAFIIGGLIFGVLFVVTLVLVVRAVLPS